MQHHAEQRSTRTSYFLCKLTPTRRTFPMDMTRAEETIVARQLRYWQDLIDAGAVVVDSAVADPTGPWGFAIVKAEAVDEVHALGIQDPTVKAGKATFTVYTLPNAIVAPHGRRRGSAPATPA